MQISETDVVIAGGASALVALARKRWPKIDGGWVWVAMFFAAAAIAGVFEVLPMLHPRVAQIVGVALAAITVVTGGKGALSQLAQAARDKLPPKVDPPNPDQGPEIKPSAGAMMMRVEGLPIPPPPSGSSAGVTLHVSGIETVPASSLDFSDAPKPAEPR